MTADEAARHATVGLVVLRDGVVTWRNDAADALTLSIAPDYPSFAKLMNEQAASCADWRSP